MPKKDRFNTEKSAIIAWATTQTRTEDGGEFVSLSAKINNTYFAVRVKDLAISVKKPHYILLLGNGWFDNRDSSKNIFRMKDVNICQLKDKQYQDIINEGYSIINKDSFDKLYGQEIELPKTVPASDNTLDKQLYSL